MAVSGEEGSVKLKEQQTHTGGLTQALPFTLPKFLSCLRFPEPLRAPPLPQTRFLPHKSPSLPHPPSFVSLGPLCSLPRSWTLASLHDKGRLGLSGSGLEQEPSMASVGRGILGAEKIKGLLGSQSPNKGPPYTGFASRGV